MQNAACYNFNFLQLAALEAFTYASATNFLKIN